MHNYAQADDATLVLRRRIEDLTAQIAELEDLRARVLEAEQRSQRNFPKQNVSCRETGKNWNLADAHHGRL